MISSQKKKEYIEKKFYNNEHPKLNKIMKDIVKQYENLEGSHSKKNFRADWNDPKAGSQEHFKFDTNVKLKPKPNHSLIYHGGVYRINNKGEIIGISKKTQFLPDKSVNWFSMSERSSQLHAVDRAYEKTIIKEIDREDFEEEEDTETESKITFTKRIDNKDYSGLVVLYLPIVYVYEIDNNTLVEIENNPLGLDFWAKSEFLPFGFDDMIVAEEICKTGKIGYRMKEDQNQVMICKTSLEKMVDQGSVRLVGAEFFNPQKWQLGTVDISKTKSLDIEKQMTSVYELYKKKIEDWIKSLNLQQEGVQYIEGLIELITIMIKSSQTFPQKDKTSKYPLLRPIEMTTNWFHDELTKKLNKYLLKDAVKDNWNDIIVEPEDVFKWLYSISKKNYDKLKLEVKVGPFEFQVKNRINGITPQLLDIDKETVFNDLKIFNGLTKTEKDSLYNKVVEKISSEVIGAKIEENFNDFMKLEVLDVVRPEVLNTIQMLANKLKDIAYVIISGGEAINMSLPEALREPTGDIDTKIIIKSEKNYAMTVMNYMNEMWYRILDEMVDQLNKKYAANVYNPLINLLKPNNEYSKELKILGFGLYHPTWNQDVQIFQKRYTRAYTLSTGFGEDNLLFAIDFQIRNFIHFNAESKTFSHQKTKYAGFLDMPLIYNVESRNHVLDKLIEYDSSRDFGKRKREEDLIRKEKIEPRRKRQKTEDIFRPQFNRPQFNLPLNIVESKPSFWLPEITSNQVSLNLPPSVQPIQRQQIIQPVVEPTQSILDITQYLPPAARPIQDTKFYFVSPKFTKDDVDMLVRLNLRPHKIEKDKNRQTLIQKIDDMMKEYNYLMERRIPMTAFVDKVKADNILKHYYDKGVFRQPKPEVKLNVVEKLDLPQTPFVHNLTDCSKISCMAFNRMLFFCLPIDNNLYKELENKFFEWYEDDVELPFEIRKSLLKSMSIQELEAYCEKFGIPIDDKETMEYSIYIDNVEKLFDKLSEDRTYWMNMESPKCMLKNFVIKTQNPIKENYSQDCYEKDLCLQRGICNIFSSHSDTVLDLAYINMCNQVGEGRFIQKYFTPFLVEIWNKRVNALNFNVQRNNYFNACKILVDLLIFDNIVLDPEIQFKLKNGFTMADFNILLSYYLIYMEGIQRFRFIPAIDQIVNNINQITKKFSNVKWF